MTNFFSAYYFNVKRTIHVFDFPLDPWDERYILPTWLVNICISTVKIPVPWESYGKCNKFTDPKNHVFCTTFGTWVFFKSWKVVKLAMCWKPHGLLLLEEKIVYLTWQFCWWPFLGWWKSDPKSRLLVTSNWGIRKCHFPIGSMYGFYICIYTRRLYVWFYNNVEGNISCLWFHLEYPHGLYFFEINIYIYNVDIWCDWLQEYGYTNKSSKIQIQMIQSNQH